MSLGSDMQNHTIIGLIKKALEQGNDIKILFYSDDYLCSSDQYLAVLGSMQRYMSKNLTISKILASSDKQFKIIDLGDHTPIYKLARKTGRPVGELLWQLAFKLSSGKLLDDCKPEDIVFLNEWPNFTRVAKTPNSFRIAALLAARPIHLDIAARLLSVPVEEVYQFYSAANTAGISGRLDRVGESSQTNPTIPAASESKGTMQRLVGKLMSL